MSSVRSASGRSFLPFLAGVGAVGRREPVAIGSGLTLPFLLSICSGAGYRRCGRRFRDGVAGRGRTDRQPAGRLAVGPHRGAPHTGRGTRRRVGGALALVLVREPWHAFAATGALGLGAAVVWPAQDALLAGLAGCGPGQRLLDTVRDDEPRGARHIGGAAIADLSSPQSFELLFGLRPRALLYAAIASRPTRDPSSPTDAANPAGVYMAIAAGRSAEGAAVDGAAVRRRLRAVLRRVPGVRDRTGRARGVRLGVAFTANALTIVVAQLLVFKVVAGWRRSRGLAVVAGSGRGRG